MNPTKTQNLLSNFFSSFSSPHRDPIFAFFASRLHHLQPLAHPSTPSLLATTPGYPSPLPPLMIGPLLKAQLVAALSKKLLESQLFVKGVESLHGTVSTLQETAYSTLEQAVRDGDRQNPPPPIRDHQPDAPPASARPTPNRSSSASSSPPPPPPTPKGSAQDQELLKFIERTRRELEKQAKR